MRSYVRQYTFTDNKMDLPFILMTSNELGLLVHLPDPDILGARLKITRTTKLPGIRPPSSRGLYLWEYEEQ